MPHSFAERLDVFCADFAALGQILQKERTPTVELASKVLTRLPNEEESEFCFRCKAVINAYSYLLEHWSAFQNLSFIRDIGPRTWIVEGHLLYALCLYLAADESCFEEKPELEVVIDAAVHPPGIK